MIQSHIGSTQECGVVLKLERFSHLSGRSFGLGSPIKLEVLSTTYGLGWIQDFIFGVSAL